MAKRKKSKRVDEILSTSRRPARSVSPDAEGEIASLWESIQEKPWHYGIGTAVIIAAVLFAVGYRQYTRSAERVVYTAYAQALEAHEPAEQAEKLEAAAAEGAVSHEVLYMMAESAIKAGEYDKAKAAFERLRAEYPNSRFVPDAVEGLGFIAQENEQYETALEAYNEVLEKWPQSFAARRQALNIARLHEERGDLEQAVAAYEEQTLVFPGSHAAMEAGAALERLRAAQPELFPVPELPLFDDTQDIELEPETPEALPEGLPPVDVDELPEVPSPSTLIIPEPEAIEE